jgi:NhaP-type Na+/H+ or K+/H+ antiporter
VWSDLITVLAGVMVMGVAGYWIQWTRRRNQAEPDAITQSLQWGLWSIVAGLIGYVLYGAGLPGSALARSTFGAWTALAVALIFGVIPMIVGWRVGLGLRTANRK